MPNNNLTDLEIKKALECCVLYKQLCPATCPLNNNERCKDILLENVLDYINRIQADSKMERLYVSQCSSVEWCKGYNSAVENANVIINRQEEQIATQQAKIERLTIRLRKAEHQLDDLCKNYNVIKAEAYKECIEKVKEGIYTVGFDLDDLLKELVGEDNG